MTIDAPVPCTTMTSNLLVNPAFEMMTTGWMETRIDNEAIIRADGTVAAHTPTLKAWMGGVLGDIGAPAVDALWQDVQIPASTTQLVVTGMYDVRTAETGGTAFDTERSRWSPPPMRRSSRCSRSVISPQRPHGPQSTTRSRPRSPG